MADPHRKRISTEPGVVMRSEIPFNRPFLVGSELGRMKESLEALTISEGGPSTERCERLLTEMTGVPAALLTTSCTHALEMAAILLKVGPGDEVVLPSFTFVSTANAFALRGARPVFADVRVDTFNLDEGSLKACLSPRTRAILVVHYAGVGCEMDDIGSIADAAGVPIIEDNAHGLMGRYKGRLLGSFGLMATQSFHETKNLTCGKGGALLLNDLSLLDRARTVRTKGTNRAQFFEGLVDKYTWVDLGSSYLPSDLLSAFLLAQLEAREKIQARRKAIWERYASALADWAAAEGVSLPTVPDHVEQTHHMFYLLLPTASSRSRFLTHLRELGVHAVFHYVPLHSSPMGKRFEARADDCPVAEDVSQRIARLPFFTGMSSAEQDRVVEAITGFSCD